MLRKTSGSVVCPSCGSLVGVNDEKCYTCGRTNPGLWGFAPLLRQLGNDFGFVPLAVGACVLMYVLSLLMTGSAAMQGGGGMLGILSPSTDALFVLGASGEIPVVSIGRWWTIFTAGWLHAGLLHILFNMMSLRTLGPLLVDLIGPGRMIIVYVLSGAAGFLWTSLAGSVLPPLPLLHGAGFTVGASAAICGLLGAVLHYGRQSGSSMIHEQAKSWAISMLVYSFLPGIDLMAHVGGFAGGYLISAMLNPLTKERGDHMLIAIGLLVLTLVAIVYSVIQGLMILQAA
jgi:rhomboid protease GluP